MLTLIWVSAISSPWLAGRQSAENRLALILRRDSSKFSARGRRREPQRHGRRLGMPLSRELRQLRRRSVSLVLSTMLHNSRRSLLTSRCRSRLQFLCRVLHRRQWPPYHSLPSLKRFLPLRSQSLYLCHRKLPQFRWCPRLLPNKTSVQAIHIPQTIYPK